MTPLKEHSSLSTSNDDDVTTNEESWTTAAVAASIKSNDNTNIHNIEMETMPSDEIEMNSPNDNARVNTAEPSRNQSSSSAITTHPSNESSNKTLLRQSMSTARLTPAEHTFLQQLLALEDEVSDMLCGLACRRLNDGTFDSTTNISDGNGNNQVKEYASSTHSLNAMALCDGAELCGGNALHVPGHAWKMSRGEEGRHGSLGDGSSGGDWVQSWIMAGAGDAVAVDCEADVSANEKEEVKKGGDDSVINDNENEQAVKEGGGDSVVNQGQVSIINKAADKEDTIDKSSSPPTLAQRQPSAQQIHRLAYKKRQSSSNGFDSTTRLYRAHERGLSITQQGSAKRTLSRLGLDVTTSVLVDNGGVMRTPGGVTSAAVHRHDVNDGNNNFTAAESITATNEREIRKLEQKERTNQKLRQRTMNELDILSSEGGGCTLLSPFTSNFLRNVYASKQFSFKRENSSYSRYDSFLNENNSSSSVVGNGGVDGMLSDDNIGIGIVDVVSTESITSTTQATSTSTETKTTNKDQTIFRPTHTLRRLNSLIVNAGFTQGTTPRGTKLIEAHDYANNNEEDDDALSLDPSVRKLIKSGGPSFNEQDIFRNDVKVDAICSDSGSPTKMGMITKKEDVPLSASLVDAVDGSSKDKAQHKYGIGSSYSITKQDQPPVSASLMSSIGSNFSVQSSSGNTTNNKEILSIQTAASRDEEEEGGATTEDNNRRATDSPNSQVGELPPLSARSSLHKRNNTISIMKSSSSSSFKKYQRSVSWGQIVMPAKEELSIVESSISPTNDDERGSNPGISVITFPNLRRATPLRSDSIGSMTSSIAPSLRMGGPIRSESMSSMISSASMGVPMLSRANPVFSPRMNDFRRVPSLHRAMRLRSEGSFNTLGTEVDDDYSAYSYNEYCDDNTQSKTVRPISVGGAAWASPFAPKRWLPPRTTSSSVLSRQSSTTSLTGKNILIRQASVNNYDGEGMEVDEIESAAVSLGNARNFKSMVSGCDSVVSGRSRSSMRSIIPFQSLDDSFVVRNINFERHSSEILRSLSNEDLYSSHHVETLGGTTSSVARVYGDLMESDLKSWDMQDDEALTPQNAWSVFEDEYAEEYGAYNSLSFRILGTSADDASCHPHVLSPPLMESLQNFLPPGIAENNFWLKYSLVRDGASLPTLLRQVRGAQHTLIAIETLEGEVFGCYTSSLWRKTWNYYGSGEAFLWRMRRTRAEKDVQHSILDQAKLESELDVFYWTGKNNLVQLCTHDLLAVGGGEFRSFSEGQSNSFSEEERDMPPPQSKTDPGGFGLAFDAEILRGTSSPCATFNSPPLSREHLDGSPFEIVNLEVWTMTPCLNVEEAEQLEMRKLFLEPYSGSQ